MAKNWRWVYGLCCSTVLVLGYMSWKHDQTEMYRKRLPAIQQGYQDLLAQHPFDRRPYCLYLHATASLSQPLLKPRYALVRQANGLSRCQELPTQADCNTEECRTLLQVGLLERAQESWTAASGELVNGEVIRLSQTGRALYFENIGTGERLRASCTPGEERYVAPEKVEVLRDQPGFCLAEGMHVREISDYLPPTRINGRVAMAVRLVLEAENPQPLLFDPRLASLLPVQPVQQHPPIYEPLTTTAFFYGQGRQVEYFDDDVRYGAWVNQSP